MSADLLVAGSIALDTLDGSFGHIENELGGSALYFALAASLITPVRVVAPVGRDQARLVEDVVGSRPIDLGLLQVIDAPTYRWRARQEAGRNVDFGSQDSIYDHWQPALPPGYSGWSFVGSMRPERQVQLASGLAGSSLLAADAMLSYVRSQPVEARDAGISATRRSLLRSAARSRRSSGVVGRSTAWFSRPARAASRLTPTGDGFTSRRWPRIPSSTRPAPAMRPPPECSRTGWCRAVTRRPSAKRSSGAWRAHRSQSKTSVCAASRARRERSWTCASRR